MIVIGVDAHKRTHTAAAVEEVSARSLGDVAAEADERGFRRLLSFAVDHGAERVWAIEDCRHVSGGLERFLLAAGETVLRVPPSLMANARKGARTRGKSDPIDALAVARAAIREPDLPRAFLAGPEREIALLVNYRSRLVSERTRHSKRLRWLLHDLDPDLEPASRTLSNLGTVRSLERRLARRERTAAVRIARDLLAQIRGLTTRIDDLRAELALLVRRHAPTLLELTGCGTLVAARIVAEVANVHRFRTEAQLALYAGVAPLDASSGRQQRHRLNRTGNRQLNHALHIIAVTQARIYAPAREYLARRRSQGKTIKEALRAFKRLLIRRVYQLLRVDTDRPDINIKATINAPCLT
ncbi:IS110 family transposase [Solirubrobacter soli]|uniref:IS110 family transposase n=1 Tax=Solirubrobacter soli TaxID=363832 RepID=UPI0004048ACA|nr:IS110 family transposase [Solirubrobacter soli]